MTNNNHILHTVQDSLSYKTAFYTIQLSCPKFNSNLPKTQPLPARVTESGQCQRTCSFFRACPYKQPHSGQGKEGSRVDLERSPINSVNEYGAHS